MKLSEFSKRTEFAQEEKQKKKALSGNQKTINEAYDELKNCSSGELMQKLAKEIQTQKTNGTFNYEAIMSSIEKIKPYLPVQTYENMIKIIDGLK